MIFPFRRHSFLTLAKSILMWAQIQRTAFCSRLGILKEASFSSRVPLTISATLPCASTGPKSIALHHSQVFAFLSLSTRTVWRAIWPQTTYSSSRRWASLFRRFCQKKPWVVVPLSLAWGSSGRRSDVVNAWRRERPSHRLSIRR